MNKYKNILVTIPYNLQKSYHGNAIRIKYMLETIRKSNTKTMLLQYDLPWLRSKEQYFYVVKPEIILAAGLSKIIFNFSFYDVLCSLLNPVRNLEKILKEIIEKEKVDIVQVENLWPLPPTINSLKNELPIIVTVHDVYSERYQEVIEYTSKTPKFLKDKVVKKVREIEVKYLNKADCIVSLTEEDKQTYSRMGIEPSKIRVIPSGVDTEKIKPEPPDPNLLRKYKRKEKDTILFFAGSLMYQNKKAIDDIASHLMPKILKKDKNVKILVAGTISKYIIHKGYNTRFPIIPLGYVDNINKYYSISDIVLIPTFLGTGFKTKTLEAMAAGKPVVTNSKSARGIRVANWDNIVICEDFDCMIEALLYLKEHKEVAKRIGENARVTAEDYDWKNVMNEYIKIYREF